MDVGVEQGQTSELYSKKEGAEAKVAMVDREIAELEEQLRVKRAERDRLQAEVAGAEAEIAKVRRERSWAERLARLDMV